MREEEGLVGYMARKCKEAEGHGWRSWESRVQGTETKIHAAIENLRKTQALQLGQCWVRRESSEWCTVRLAWDSGESEMEGLLTAEQLRKLMAGQEDHHTDADLRSTLAANWRVAAMARHFGTSISVRGFNAQQIMRVLGDYVVGGIEINVKELGEELYEVKASWRK